MSKIWNSHRINKVTNKKVITMKMKTNRMIKTMKEMSRKTRLNYRKKSKIKIYKMIKV